MSLTVKFKKLKETAQLPTKSTAAAAGYDLYACLESPLNLLPHRNVVIGTGLAFEMPEGYFGAIFSRGYLAVNHGIRPANGVGVVDPDYRGELFISLHNDSEKAYTISPNDRIAQIVFMPYLTDFTFVEEPLSDTDRSKGDIGSTGQ